MSYEFEYLMQLFAAASHGFAAEPPREAVDWDAIARMAAQHRVLALVGYALKHSGDLGCPAVQREKLVNNMRGMAAQEYLRRRMVFQLLADMESEGMSVTLLKGFDAARAYAVPECRISADVDLWVPPEQEKRACGFLQSKGFAVEPRWANGHHAVCHHPRMGCVELHVLLYDEIVEDIWFDQTDGQEFVCEPRRRWDSPDGPCYVLGLTDDLIFMSLHMIKHFIQGTMRLLMLMDVALFVKANRSELDMTRFWETMRSLRYEELMRTLFCAAADYLMLEPELVFDHPVDNESQTHMLLADVEAGAGGAFGEDEGKNREESWYEYNRQRLMQKRGAASYRLYMLRWRFAAVKTAIRPTRTLLEEKYPWLRRHPWFLPWAWLCYMGRKGSGFLRQGFFRRVASQPSVSESAQTRLELFRALDMM